MLFTNKILSCRPKEQAEKLANIMQAHGFESIVFPTVEIQPIDVIQKFIPLSKIAIQQADIILIQSPSVLTYLDSTSFAMLAASNAIYAMGAGTQEALRGKNIPSRWVAHHGAASEHILSQSPISELPENSKILLLTGEGGRSVLEPELSQKGFMCERINTYKRTIPIYTQQQINNILAQAPDVILVTSVDILKNLLVIFKDNVNNIKNLPLLVISPRIQNAAVELDWQGEILLADSAGSEAILKKLKDYYAVKNISAGKQ